MSLFIGFIDGDGCIRNQTSRNDFLLTIHVHKNWYNNILFMENFIYNFFKIPKNKQLTKIGNDGYARVIITNNFIIKQLKIKTIELNLPVLSRKWAKIDENKLSKPEIIKVYKEEIITLHNKGMKLKDITKLGKYTEGLIYKTIKNLK